MDGWNRDGRSGNGTLIRWLLYVHTDSNVNSREKGEGWSKASRGIFFLSRALHINQQTLAVAVVGAGAHSQCYQSRLLMMLQKLSH